MRVNTTENRQVELLAPAGSLQSFAAAMEAGADAVYIGAPELNARNLARHFSLAEIAAMVEDVRRRRKKLYVAMNSLAKEEELKRVFSQLSFFATIGVDGLIVQDVGIASLARQYFPGLPLHASTLMTAHNSLAVEAIFARGFKRVVLARELTIEEIGAIHRRCPGELEVFVHGAMCFSYSGLCLFSSYQGGKSGLRGRCVQPCRRRYTVEGGARRSGGYLFSMHDMQAIDLLPALIGAGVCSFKIEGRMRPASYVEKVVTAYRMVLDRPAEPEAVDEARTLLESALGRKSSTGFFLSKQPESLLSPEHSGNTGVFIGKIEAVRGRRIRCLLRQPLVRGDRLRLHQERSGERVAFTLQAISCREQKRSSARAGEQVTIEVPAKASKGDSLFLVDAAASRKKEGARSAVLPEVKKIPAARLLQNDRSQALLDDFYKRRKVPAPAAKVAKHRISGSGGSRQKRGRKGSRAAVLPYFLRIDDFAPLRQRLERKPLGYIVVLNPATLAQFGKSRLPGPLRQQILWGLPPIIDEENLPFYRQEIGNLIGKGFTSWQISHLSHLDLFDPARQKGRHRRQPLVLYGHYTLNICNSAALFVYEKAGLQGLQIAVETDRENLSAVAAKSGKTVLGMMVYGFPPLFTARLRQEAALPYGKIIVSPKREKFRVLQEFGQTVVTAAHPFCLLDRQEELERAKISFVVIDLTGTRMSRKDWQELNRMLKRGWCGSQPTDKFNFAGTLQ